MQNSTRNGWITKHTTSIENIKEEEVLEYAPSPLVGAKKCSEEKRQIKHECNEGQMSYSGLISTLFISKCLSCLIFTLTLIIYFIKKIKVIKN
jgi:hypothetical protein